MGVTAVAEVRRPRLTPTPDREALDALRGWLSGQVRRAARARQTVELGQLLMQTMEELTDDQRAALMARPAWQMHWAAIDGLICPPDWPGWAADID